MRSAGRPLYDEVKFKALMIAVEEGEVRFSQIFKYIKSKGAISKKKVSQILKNLVSEGLLRETKSLITKRKAYRATMEGVKWYSLQQGFSLIKNFLNRFSQLTGFALESASIPSLIDFMDGFGLGITLSFLLSLNVIKDYCAVEDYEKSINLIAEAMGEGISRILGQIGLHIIKREDLKEKVKDWVVNNYFPRFLEFKNQMSKIDPDFSRIPEVLAMENILRVMLKEGS